MRVHTHIALALLLVLGASIRLHGGTGAIERLTFARPPAPESTVDPKDRLPLTVERWSTDAERDQVLQAIAENGERQVLDGLRDVARIGTLWWPGGLEYDVRYARTQSRADGGADVVLLLDRPLWVWWDAKAASTTYPYTVVQLRLGKDGRGEGRTSLDNAIVTDPKLGIMLKDYASAAVRLSDVRREKLPVT